MVPVTPFMTWLNFANYLLGVIFMSLLKNLLCKLFEGLLYGLAPELDSWGPLHTILTRPKGKVCLLVIFSSLLSCPSSSCWDVSFPPGVPALLTKKSATYFQAKFSGDASSELQGLGQGSSERPAGRFVVLEHLWWNTPVCDGPCVFFRESNFVGHYL